jgi:hypothetical protein
MLSISVRAWRNGAIRSVLGTLMRSTISAGPSPRKSCRSPRQSRRRARAVQGPRPRPAQRHSRRSPSTELHNAASCWARPQNDHCSSGATANSSRCAARTARVTKPSLTNGLPSRLQCLHSAETDVRPPRRGSGVDPSETWRLQPFARKSIVRPSLKRDILPCSAWA